MVGSGGRLAEARGSESASRKSAADAAAAAPEPKDDTILRRLRSRGRSQQSWKQRWKGWKKLVRAWDNSTCNQPEIHSLTVHGRGFTTRR